jgi:hypothetical protein
MGDTMASYRLISGTTIEVNQQLALLSAANREREGNGPAQKPILMTSTTAVTPQGAAHITVHVIVQTE